jgi:flavin-dependent dehydrogenase
VDDYDAVVVGASIAGCTVATFLGRQGARVALLERSPNEDLYKVICTHAIMPCATGTFTSYVLRVEPSGVLPCHQPIARVAGRDGRSFEKGRSAAATAREFLPGPCRDVVVNNV